VLKGVVEVLRRRADNRLTPATAVEVLQVLLQSASLRLDFLEKLPDGTPVIVAVTDTILSTVFDPNQDPAVAWRLLGRQTLSEVVEVTLRVMADHSLTPAAAVKKLGQALTAEIRSLVNDDGFDLESFATALAKKLAA
jgi:anaerobic glycerol-3-phosphate dehydrogenase